MLSCAWVAPTRLAEAESQTLETAGDRILSGVPLFHSYGFDLGVLNVFGG